jgi:hypothetical protein
MKVVRLANGYRVRCNNAEFAALQSLVAQALAFADITQQRKMAEGDVKRGFLTLSLKVTDDRRGDLAQASA